MTWQRGTRSWFLFGAVGLVAALISACGSTPTGQGGRTGSTTGAGPAHSATSGSAATGAPSSASSTGQSGSAGSSASSAAHTGAAGSAPGGSPPAHIASSGVLAAPGTYVYTVSGSSSGSDTAAIANQQPTATGTGQTATITDNGNQVVSGYTWSAASVLLNDVQTRSSKGSADCRLSSPIIEEQFPLSAGETWNSDATCPVSQGAISGTVHWTESDTVSGSTTVTVDGVAVACWTITRQITIQLQGAAGTAGSGSSATQVDDYAPDLGLPARTTVTSKGSSRTLTLQHRHPS